MLVKFEVYNDGEYWCARGIGEDIFTQATTLDESLFLNQRRNLLPKLPVVSRKQLIKLLTKRGYEVVRQKGSHLRLKNLTEMGEHNITIPLHNEIAKGRDKTLCR